jgi:hypothetical protein
MVPQDQSTSAPEERTVASYAEVLRVTATSTDADEPARIGQAAVSRSPAR